MRRARPKPIKPRGQGSSGPVRKTVNATPNIQAALVFHCSGLDALLRGIDASFRQLQVFLMPLPLTFFPDVPATHVAVEPVLIGHEEEIQLGSFLNAPWR